MREEIRGTHVLNDLRVGHTEHEVKMLLEFIDKYKVKKFVEIGVHEGGLTQLLIEIPGLKYLGMDINPGIAAEHIREKALILGGDCFNSIMKSKVSYFINSLFGTSIIYCDNGNKPKELVAYVDIPNVGDILMAHDYYDPNRQVRGLEGFGTTLKSPEPEVLPEDVEFLRNDLRYTEVTDLLEETRICAFMRR